jgi:hypothetical protein
VHYFPKAEIGQFLIEEGSVCVGDKILIVGPTTGTQEVIISEMFVNDRAAQSASSGDYCSIKLPFRIRLSDKLYSMNSD